MNGFPRTPPEIISRLYELLCFVHQVCKQHNIKYWVIGGTLLGLERHGHIIPWDDDADVGIFEADEEHFYSCMVSYLKGHQDAVVHRSEHGFKIKCTRKKGVGVDVFIYKIYGDLVALAKKVSAECWPRDYFLAHEINSVKERTLGPITVCTVPLAHRYLVSVYGNDCMEVASLDFCHLENKMHDGFGIKIPLATALLLQ